MKKQMVGIMLGGVAGIVDVTPMIMQKLTWDANLSAVALWLVTGFLIAVVDLEIRPVFKGLLTAFLVLLPSAILIGWQHPAALVPIAVMTSILGSLLGVFIDRYSV